MKWEARTQNYLSGRYTMPKRCLNIPRVANLQPMDFQGVSFTLLILFMCIEDIAQF